MDVVVSMMPSKRRKVYHRPNCVYVENEARKQNDDF